MDLEQLNYYQKKLTYEMDSADLFFAINTDDKIIIIDGRVKEAYEKEHIPNAINLPHKEICANTIENLDKSKTYICYCDGIGCNGSTKTAFKLLTLGFKVKELIGGLDWWKRDGYTTKGTQGKVREQNSCAC